MQIYITEIPPPKMIPESYQISGINTLPHPISFFSLTLILSNKVRSLTQKRKLFRENRSHAIVIPQFKFKYSINSLLCYNDKNFTEQMTRRKEWMKRRNLELVVEDGKESDEY